MTDSLYPTCKNHLNKIIITGVSCCFYCELNLAFEFSSGSEISLSEPATVGNFGAELQALAFDSEQWKCLKSIDPTYSSSNFQTAMPSCNKSIALHFLMNGPVTGTCQKNCQCRTVYRCVLLNLQTPVKPRKCSASCQH